MVLPKEGCTSGATLYDTPLSLPFPLPAKRVKQQRSIKVV